MEYKNEGLFTRELSGAKVTDTKLAAIAVCTATRGGLGKLFIQGNESSRVTNQGLKDIARGCPSLKVLSVSDISSIGDEGLCEIANGCRLLKELELINISSISNDGLIAIAEKCPELKFLTLDSCANVRNETLQALAWVRSQLESITIKDSPLIGDLGVTSLLSPPIPTLTKVKLHGLMISDVTLASIGLYHSSIKNLSLNRINAVTKGFWAMAEGFGLRSITSLTVSSCYCMTDQILEVFGRGFPGLKQLFLRNYCLLSDFGLVSFSKSATGLERLELESYNRITLEGVKSLQSISVKEYDAFGSVALILLGKLCQKLRHLELNGLHKTTDDGLISFLESLLNLDGCEKITDATLLPFVSSCSLLEDLDLSYSRVSDSAVAGLSCWKQHKLKVLSPSGCTKITNNSMPYLTKLGRNLQGLNLQGWSSMSRQKIGSLVPILQKRLKLSYKLRHRVAQLTVIGLRFSFYSLLDCDIVPLLFV
ncbi:EIN3-binding F-box protein 1-like protein [Drosera capensis]